MQEIKSIDTGSKILCLTAINGLVAAGGIGNSIRLWDIK